MAHSGDGTGWDVTSPADAEPRKDGAMEIRDLRKAAAIRLNKEHITLATSSAGGEHKSGSAKAYSIDSGDPNPTKRPDAATNLNVADRGRLLVIANVVYHWSGTAWVPTGGGIISSDTVTCPGDGSYSSWVTLSGPPRVIIFDGSSGLSFVCRSPDTLTASDYTCARITGGAIALVSYIVQNDNPNSRFRIKQGTVQPGPGTAFRYAAFGAE